jgi:putative endonuclease
MSILKQYFVYILASRTRTTYIGVTNDLDRRLYEHKNQIIKGFTSKYQIDSLVYFESFVDVNEAIVREKEIKKWRREKKDALIESMNSDWEDISVRWGK